MQIQVAYRAEARRYKRKRDKAYLVTRLCLFEVKTGRNLILFDLNCPKWVVWKWFRYMNTSRGLCPKFVKQCTPAYEDFKPSRLRKIEQIYEKLINERILEAYANTEN